MVRKLVGKFIYSEVSKPTAMYMFLSTLHRKLKYKNLIFWRRQIFLSSGTAKEKKELR